MGAPFLGKLVHFQDSLVFIRFKFHEIELLFVLQSRYTEGRSGADSKQSTGPDDLEYACGNVGHPTSY
jgi:hypothetical protein